MTTPVTATCEAGRSLIGFADLGLVGNWTDPCPQPPDSDITLTFAQGLIKAEMKFPVCGEHYDILNAHGILGPPTDPPTNPDPASA